jgi:ubiquitin-protein ligase
VNQLDQLESEGIFIPEVNPFKVLKSKNRQLCTQQHFVVVLYGRIFTQVEPYRGASFLIKIGISPPYPFKTPEITFLDPICNPNIKENGTLSY